LVKFINNLIVCLVKPTSPTCSHSCLCKISVYRSAFRWRAHYTSRDTSHLSYYGDMRCLATMLSKPV